MCADTSYGSEYISDENHEIEIFYSFAVPKILTKGENRKPWPKGGYF